MAMNEEDTQVIYLEHPEGRQLLAEVQNGKAGHHQPILQIIFSRQTTGGGCGIQSCALALSANALGSQFEPSQLLKTLPVTLPYTELGMYEMPETLEVTNRHSVSRGGLTLEEVAAILRSHGCSVRTTHAASCSASQFRSDVIEALSSVKSQNGLIVNFSRSGLNKDSERSHWAHHSPLVAYHKLTDRVLVLDTAAPLNRHFWATVDSLFLAMLSTDRTSRKSRGYCIFSKG